MRWIAFLWVVCAAAINAAPTSSPKNALEDYVAAPDSSFGWHVLARYSPPGADVVALELTSQTWQGIVWKHQLYVFRPHAAGVDARQGLLVVGGGRWHDRFETEPAKELPDDAKIFLEMARRLDAVVAVVGQVPFQPMFDLNEDSLIAYTFDRYLKTGDADWPLLLPMVKSVVKAMDATQQFMISEWHEAPQRFTVLGGSKRGWTTWLLGAVEPRAAVLVPVVIDALNFRRNMPYQSTVWGAPSPALAPYTKLHLIDILGSSQGEALREIVDPYSYRKRLTQPKLVVVATNDPYFPLDALNLYWDALPPPKYILYAPNQTHSMDDYGRLIPTMNAVHRASEGGASLPAMKWEFQSRDHALRLCVRSVPEPGAVVAWTADSTDAGFVHARFSSQPVAADRGVFVFDLARPDSGYRAVFAETAFGAGDAKYTLSTNVRITDPAGHAPSRLTEIRGTPGVCPAGARH
jgi:PhoPQ-activated pathogenicity-related protein